MREDITFGVSECPQDNRRLALYWRAIASDDPWRLLFTGLQDMDAARFAAEWCDLGERYPQPAPAWWNSDEARRRRVRDKLTTAAANE
jgi:hypothetical protein